MEVRAQAVKAELSDVEGLGFKLEERQKDILELKKTLKMKVLGTTDNLIPSPSDLLLGEYGNEAGACSLQNMRWVMIEFHLPLIQAQELSESNVKIGLLEKKVESADAECTKKVEAERKEVERFKEAFDEQER